MMSSTEYPRGIELYGTTSLSNGDFVISGCGLKSSHVSGFVTRINPTGQIVWAREIQQSSLDPNDGLAAVATTSDDKILFLGVT